MPNIDTEIRAVVDSFVEQLRTLIRRAALESVQDALGDRGAAPRGPKPKNAPSRVVAVGRGKGQKRSSEELEELVRKLHSHVAKNPGQRIEEIGRALGVATKELMLPVKKLLAEKKFSKKGQKRATTYAAK